jgi:peptidoglycan hydrolase CwlO-like protein
MQKDQEPKLTDINSIAAPAKQESDAYTPPWIKIFGGSIVSGFILVLLTCIGYIANIQSSINTQFNTHKSETWEALKDLGPLKEKVNSIEQLAKERAFWVEKIESRLSNSEKNMDIANKEIAALKEKISGQEQLVRNFQEENKQFVKDIQSLRERLVFLEGKKSE